MKRSLFSFVVLFFVAGCGGGSSVSEPENSSDFEEIEIPLTFMVEDGLLSDSNLNDAHLVPDKIVELFKDALTIEASRIELIRRTREASFCNALDDVSDQEIWNEMVDQFNFNSKLHKLHTSGNSLEEAIRNLLAYDLDLELDEELEVALYGDTLDEEDFLSILADEVDGLDTSPGQCLDS